jgi:hypothetical protein
LEVNHLEVRVYRHVLIGAVDRSLQTEVTWVALAVTIIVSSSGSGRASMALLRIEQERL